MRSLPVLRHAPTMRLNQVGAHVDKDAVGGVCSASLLPRHLRNGASPRLRLVESRIRCYNEHAKNIHKLHTFPARRSSLRPGDGLPGAYERASDVGPLDET